MPKSERHTYINQAKTFHPVQKIDCFTFSPVELCRRPMEASVCEVSVLAHAFTDWFQLDNFALIVFVGTSSLFKM